MAEAKRTESQIADENWRAYTRARDSGHREYITRAKRYDDYYKGGGKQWAPADRAKVEGKGAPALEINMVLSTVNAALGEHIARRVDFQYKARTAEYDDTASALTAQVKQICDNNAYPWRESQMFSDGLIQDRGYIDVRMDFSDNIAGEVRMNCESPLHVLPDPDGIEYDPATWKEVIITRWVTLDDIELLYGKEKRLKVEALPGAGVTYGQDSIDYDRERFATGLLARDIPMIRRVRVVERQYRKMSMQRCYVDNASGDIRPIPDQIKDKAAVAFAQANGLSITKRMLSRIRWTVTCDITLLHDEWSPYRSFTVVPYFPYFRRGEPFGMVRNLTGPQDQLNKVDSQELHIINTTANSGWVVRAGSLLNMTEDQLEERGGETGLVLVVAPDADTPEKIQPNSVPPGISHVAAKAANYVHTISGVNEAMTTPTVQPGMGKTLEQGYQRGLTQLQVPFDNLDRTRHLLAAKLLELVQDFYTETRVVRVMDHSTPRPEQKEYTLNGVESGTGELFNDVTLGEYDIVISTSPAKDTADESEFSAALAMRKEGIVVPDDYIIEVSPLRHKHELAERVRQMTGQTPPSEEDIQLAQMQQQTLMQRAQLELAQLQAEVQKLQAESQALVIKAQAAMITAEASGQAATVDAQLEVARLQAELQKQQNDLSNKIELARLHIDAKTENTRLTALGKQTAESIRLRANAELEAGRHQAELVREGLRHHADMTKEKLRLSKKSAAPSPKPRA